MYFFIEIFTAPESVGVMKYLFRSIHFECRYTLIYKLFEMLKPGNFFIGNFIHLNIFSPKSKPRKRRNVAFDEKLWYDNKKEW